MKTLLPVLTIFCVALCAAPARCDRAHDGPVVGYHLLRQFHLDGDTGWDALTVDERSHRLYVTRGTYVAVLDTRGGALVGEVSNTSGVHDVAVDPRGNRGYASDGRVNCVTIFRTGSLKTEGIVLVGQNPDGILFDPLTERVFTFNGKDNSSSVIDTHTGHVVATIALPGKPEFAVADGKGHIYDNLEDKDEVAVIDTQGLLVQNLWSLGAGDGPTGIAVDAVHHRLFSACANQKLIVLDADDGHPVADLPIGKGADGCAYDDTYGLVFCPGGQNATLTIYKQETPDRYTLLATVGTQEGARTIALDHSTHHLFTITATRAADTAGENGGRRMRHYVPGSFVVLEYAPTYAPN